MNISLKEYFINYKKLIEYGFFKKNNCYFYETYILDDNYLVMFSIMDDILSYVVLDAKSMRPFDYYSINKRNTCEAKRVVKEINSFIDNHILIYDMKNTIKNSMVLKIINYIRDKYKDEVEFPWDNISSNIVFRHLKSKKWYVFISNVCKDKLGLESKEIVSVINLKYPKDKRNDIIDNKSIFKGYHMNKDNWITILLDDNYKIENIYKLIDISYNHK